MVGTGSGVRSGTSGGTSGGTNNRTGGSAKPRGGFNKRRPRSKVKEHSKRQAMLNTHRVTPFKYDLNEIMVSTQMDEPRRRVYPRRRPRILSRPSWKTVISRKRNRTRSADCWTDTANTADSGNLFLAFCNTISLKHIFTKYCSIMPLKRRSYGTMLHFIADNVYIDFRE